MKGPVLAVALILFRATSSASSLVIFVGWAGVTAGRSSCTDVRGVCEGVAAAEVVWFLWDLKRGMT